MEFQNYGEQRTIEFHKDEEKSAGVNQQDSLVCIAKILYSIIAILYTYIIFLQFTGPWRVSNMLLEEIISRKKLRVTKIETLWYFKDREACDLGTNATSLEAFCVLFLGKSKIKIYQ
jgi:hypothetical protein